MIPRRGVWSGDFLVLWHLVSDDPERKAVKNAKQEEEDGDDDDGNQLSPCIVQGLVMRAGGSVHRCSTTNIFQAVLLCRYMMKTGCSAHLARPAHRAIHQCHRRPMGI